MRRRRYVKRMYALVIEVMFMFICRMATGQPQVPVSCKGPLSEEQLTRLLTSGVADARTQAFVQKCGIAFEPTAAIDKHLKEAGASDALLTLAHRRSRNAQKAAALRESIHHAIDSSMWEDAKTKLAELKSLVPDDDDMRSWAAVIDEHERLERKRQQELEEQKHREELRLTELRRKLGIDGTQQRLAPTLTLDEARERLRSLRVRRGDIETRLKGEYPDLQDVRTPVKDTFETTAEYETRVAKAAEERKAREVAYGRDLQALAGPYSAQIAELLSRQYLQPGAKVTLKSYDADTESLFAAVGGCVYAFKIAPAKARTIYGHEASLRVQGSFLRMEEEHNSCAAQLEVLDPEANLEVDTTLQPYPFGFFPNGWMQLNGSAKMVGTRLRLTDGGVDEAATAFLNHFVSVKAFSTSFGFQLKQAAADGFTVVFQNAGLSAIGSLGAGLGYRGDSNYSMHISRSVAVKFQFFSGRDPSVGLLRNGNYQESSISLKASRLDICNGDVYAAQIDYDGTKLSLTLTDSANPNSKFSTSWDVDIPAVVGTTTAYVGFTAGTGSLTSTQEIVYWIYTPFTWYQEADDPDPWAPQARNGNEKLQR